MLETYYINELIASLISGGVLCAVFSGAFYIWINRCEKEGKKPACKACENRKGLYRPKTCQNCNCKYFD